MRSMDRRPLPEYQINGSEQMEAGAVHAEHTVASMFPPASMAQAIRVRRGLVSPLRAWQEEPNTVVR
jgi:hypothetical protein